jgi:flagellar M-ring protein FliF
MRSWWNTLALHARIVLLAATLATLAGAGGVLWWVLRGDPAVLFSDLRPQDAALLSTELDKLKIPYAIADGGGTLMVDRSQVHTARLKLMGKELPLHGSVGFELFNTADFGMTEFAQKINYQRALQGELTRTILSFPEVRDARVHLALPEQGLFRQATVRPKAAITLTLRSGQALRKEQVSGIQRLVAAAVPNLLAQEVTIVDQEGVALTRAADADAEGAGGGARLELKREMENYLSRKAGLVLDKLFGPGQALASVDLSLNMDQVRVTTEDVIAAPDIRGGPPAGVLVRERESARDSASPELRSGDARSARGSSMQRDVEYQAGRRVEQVVGQAGAIRRMHVAVVVRQELGAQQAQQVRKLVEAAIGAAPERGDSVVIEALHAEPKAASGPPVSALPASTSRVEPADATLPLPLVLLACAVIGLGLLALMVTRLRDAARPPVLTAAQRDAALHQVQAWLLQAPDDGRRPHADATHAAANARRMP